MEDRHAHGRTSVDAGFCFVHSLADPTLCRIMNELVEIVRLSRTSRDVLRFLNVSYAIYEGDPNWVAPLLMDLKKVFTDENPLFQHARMELWVARKAGRDVGRIA